MPTLRDLLADGRVHVLDGAMGTMLYGKGVFLNVCYDELSLKQPDLVAEVHDAYVRAGAEAIETNTFGANPVKLAGHGLAEQTEAINRAAAALARRVAGDRAAVLGAVGPLGVRLEPFGPTSRAEARDAFRRQISGLVAGGVDGFILETFADTDEIHEALLAAREVSDLPVIAQMTIGDDGSTAYGTARDVRAPPDGMGRRRGRGELLRRPGGRARGGGAHREGDGPADLRPPQRGAAEGRGGPQDLPREPRLRGELRAAHGHRGGALRRRLLRDHARPHQARPRLRGERRAAPAGRGNRAGCRRAAGGGRGGAARPALAFRRKLAVGGQLGRLPPRVDAGPMLEQCRALKIAGVDAVNLPDGPRAQSRMGALPSALLIEREVGIETVAHYCCRDRNLLGMLSDLLGAHAAGLRNILIITGDPPKMGPYPDATAIRHRLIASPTRTGSTTGRPGKTPSASRPRG
jgi:homocysteine S-methyltransferase